MTDQPLAADEAAKILLAIIVDRAYHGVVKDAVTMLQNGPPGRKPRARKSSLHRWYQGLDSPSRELVQALVEETASEAVFGCLVVLDNMTTGYPIEGKLSDFAVYLQTYKDLDSIKAGQPQSSVRLNPPNSVEGDLHDLFTTVLNESSQ